LRRLKGARKEVLTKHHADGVFLSFFLIRDAPGKRLEVDLVYPNIYIDMSYSFSLSVFVLMYTFVITVIYITQNSDWIG
jgi:hypothetical protein